MKELLKYEFVKIAGRKVNLIAMVLGLLLIVMSNILVLRDDSLYISEENSLKGIAAIRTRTEMENQLTPELSEEFLTAFLRDYQQTTKEQSLEYDWSRISKNRNLFVLIADNYTAFNDHWSWEYLLTINTDGGIGFYGRRTEKIKSILNADYSYGNYTEAEKQYWLHKNASVSTPFIWGSNDTWSVIWDSVCLLIYLLFVISICIAPVFSGEYQNRTDALLLASKYGKNKLIHAKILAAFLFTFLYMTLCSIINIGISIGILGIDGWNLPVQLWYTVIPYPWTVLTACVMNLLILFLISFLLTGVSLWLSSICKSPMIVLATDILLFYGTLFIPWSKASRLWNQILYLLPIHCFNLQDVLRKYNCYSFGNLVFSHLDMIIIVYLLLTILCVCFAGRCFKKHQIG